MARRLRTFNHRPPRKFGASRGANAAIMNNLLIPRRADNVRFFTDLDSAFAKSFLIPEVSLPTDFKITFNAEPTSNTLRPVGASGNFNNNIELSTASLTVDTSGTVSTIAGAFDIQLNKYSFWEIQRIGANVTYTLNDVLLGTSTGSTGTLVINTINNISGFYGDGILANLNIFDANGDQIHGYPIDEDWTENLILHDTIAGANGTAENITDADATPFTFSMLFNSWLTVELITNMDFAVDSDWIKGTGWTISGGQALHDGTGTTLKQTSVGIVSGFTYFTAVDVASNTGSITNPIFLGNDRFLDIHLPEGISSVIDTYDGSGSDQWQIFGRTSELLVLNNVTLKRILQLAIALYAIHTLGDSFATLNFSNALNQNLSFTGDMSVDGVGGTTLVAQAARFDLTPEFYDDILVIMDGGLNDGSANAIIAIDDMVANLTHDNWVYVQPSPEEDIEGSPARIAWNADVAAIVAHVGADHYVECLTALKAGNDGSANDLQDVADNIVPRSLRTDTIHETARGTDIRTAQIASFIRSNY